MIDRKVVRNYASCLFANMESKEQRQKVLEQMNLFNEVLQNSSLARFALYAPVISKPDKMKVILGFGQKFKFEKVLLQFFRVIIKNARFQLLSNIATEYEELIAESQGVKSVAIEAAAKLGKKELGILQEYLEKKLQKTVKLDITKNESLIGGVVIKYDSLLYDFSVAGAIDKFEKIAREA